MGWVFAASLCLNLLIGLIALVFCPVWNSRVRYQSSYVLEDNLDGTDLFHVTTFFWLLSLVATAMLCVLWYS